MKIILSILLIFVSSYANTRALYIKKYSNENKVALVIGNRKYKNFTLTSKLQLGSAYKHKIDIISILFLHTTKLELGSEEVLELDTF